jgi:hypothetical protein
MEQQEASQPLLELVGLAEIASTLGVSKQRVQELAANDQLFPPPIAKVSGGTLYMKSMIDAFKAHRAPTPGRPGNLQIQVSEELSHIPKDRQNPVQQSLRMIYNITRLHDLKVDPSASRHQSLFVALTQTPRQGGPVPRFDTGFFQPEPPEERYRVLHAECEQGHDMSLWTKA